MLTPLFQSTFHHKIPFVVLEAPILRCWSVGSPVPMLPGKTLLQSMRRHIGIEKDPTTKRRESLDWCPRFATESKRRVSRMSRKCSCVALMLGSVTFGTPHLAFRNTCKYSPDGLNTTFSLFGAQSENPIRQRFGLPCIPNHQSIQRSRSRSSLWARHHKSQRQQLARFTHPREVFASSPGHRSGEFAEDRDPSGMITGDSSFAYINTASCHPALKENPRRTASSNHPRGDTIGPGLRFSQIK